LKTEPVSDEELREIEAKPRARRGEWSEIIETVKKTKKAVKTVEKLTRGQLAAGQRAAKAAGLRAFADWKNLTLVIAPEVPEVKKAK